MVAVPSRFDLAGARTGTAYWASSVTRWLGLSAMVAFTLLGLSLVVPLYARHHSLLLPLGADGLLLFFAFVVGMGVIAYRKNARGADSLEVTDWGVVFEFASGRTWRLGWSDPGFLLVLSRTEPVQGPHFKRPLVLVAGTRWLLLGFLTSEAYDAVLQGARVHGLNRVGGLPGRYGAVITELTPRPLGYPAELRPGPTSGGV